MRIESILAKELRSWLLLYITKVAIAIGIVIVCNCTHSFRCFQLGLYASSVYMHHCFDD